MTRIVTTHYRYKRPPRKKRAAVALEIPAVVTIRDRERVVEAHSRPASSPNVRSHSQPAQTTVANDDRKPAIVTIRRKPERVLPPGLLPETPEEHKRRGDGADAMFREMKRQIAKERT